MKRITVAFFIKGILPILLVLGYTIAVAQGYNYTQYKTDQGLAGNIVYSITQDKEGFLWFGTETGVSRFDGTSFQNFTIKDGLPDNIIYQVLADSKGRVWFVPFKQAIAYYYKGKIHNSKNDTLLRQTNYTTLIRSVAEDAQHNIAIASNCEVFVISPDNKINALHNKPSAKGLITALGQDEYKKFNILSPNGIYQINDEQLTYRTSLPGADKFYTIQMEIRGRNVFWRTNKGFYVKKNEQVRHFDIPPVNNFQVQNDSLVYVNTATGSYQLNINSSWLEREYLPGKSVSAYFRDNEGNTWFATLGEGIFRIHSELFRSLRYTSDNRPLKVFSLFDNGNNILVGTDNACLRLDLYPFKQLAKEPVFKTEWPVHIIYKNEDALFLATKTELFVRHHNGIYKYDAFKHIVKKMAIHQNQLVIATSSSLRKLPFHISDLVKNPSDQVLYQGRTTTVYVDNDSLYFGTPEGLYKLVGDSLLTKLSDISPHLQDRVADICKTADGILWVGTGGNGITALRNDKMAFHMTANTGISSDAIHFMTPDTDGSIWVGTEKGLDWLKIINDSIHVVKYTAADGLISNAINAIVVKGDTVYAGTPEGLTYFDKRNHNFHSRCDLKIMDVSANGKHISLKDLTRLTYGNNQVRINFTAISFKSAGDIRYMYRLKGLDSSWQMTRQRQLDFISLPPGEYALELYAINRFNVKSKTILLPVTIHPQFWQTGWFNVVIILCVILLTWGVIAWSNQLSDRKKTVQRQMERRLQDLEQKALRAQINPHFIFNCLHAIQGYIIDRDIPSANHYLSSFARLIRQTLDNSMQTMITVADEITYLTTYLNLERLRFEDAFLFNFYIDKHIDKDHTFLPGMMLQPYVENAIRHGIQNKTDGQGTINIRFIQREQYLICIVEDNGVGRAVAQTLKTSQHIEYQSRGMQLTEERIRLLSSSFDTPIEINITDKLDERLNVIGTEVTIKLTLIYGSRPPEKHS
ncbi:histidine kinase [Chitinophaga pendula]|uniref:sensor histidine kinase n=1 Tax=Chitinophaga TaxID=79328 RepID=UPI000BB00167|nr:MULTISPECIES: sensor histidine kinase [Chitinophaga]ASZ13125.1 hypothetical protein CK934_20260 [Chitinophaga sp. MD30]UCJ09249.1 histidine kinase [Chitinophaga pendula]